MEKKRLVLTGTAGYSEGEIFSIPVGESAIVGRSRSCDFSLRKLRSWMDADKDEREGAEEFKTVSRRHIKIEVSMDGDDIKASITDLSRNGTYVDEDRIDARFDITDWDIPHYLRLGELEQYKLEIKDAGDDLEGEKQIPDEDEDGDAPDEETDRHEKEVEEEDEDDDENGDDDGDDDEDNDDEDEDE